MAVEGRIGVNTFHFQYYEEEEVMEDELDDTADQVTENIDPEEPEVDRSDIVPKVHEEPEEGEVFDDELETVPASRTEEHSAVVEKGEEKSEIEGEEISDEKANQSEDAENDSDVSAVKVSEGENQRIVVAKHSESQEIEAKQESSESDISIIKAKTIELSDNTEQSNESVDNIDNVEDKEVENVDDENTVDNREPNEKVEELNEEEGELNEEEGELNEDGDEDNSDGVGEVEIEETLDIGEGTSSGPQRIVKPPSVAPALTRNQMELLELEMRARAIKAMLKTAK